MDASEDATLPETVGGEFPTHDATGRAYAYFVDSHLFGTHFLCARHMTLEHAKRDTPEHEWTTFGCERLRPGDETIKCSAEACTERMGAETTVGGVR